MEQRMTTVQNFLKVDLKQFEATDKAVVVKMANNYTTALRSNGDVGGAYNALYNTLKQMESKYNIVIFAPEMTDAAVISQIAQAIDVATSKFVGAKSYFCTFKTVEEANGWLARQSNIVINKFSVESNNSFGVHIKGIRIEYTPSETPNSNRYRISIEKKFRMFVSSNANKFCQKWQEKNSDKRLVKYDKKHSSFCLIGGSVGFLRFVIERYFMLYSY